MPAVHPRAAQQSGACSRMTAGERPSLLRPRVKDEKRESLWGCGSGSPPPERDGHLGLGGLDLIYCAARAEPSTPQKAASYRLHARTRAGDLSSSRSATSRLVIVRSGGGGLGGRGTDVRMVCPARANCGSRVVKRRPACSKVRASPFCRSRGALTRMAIICGGAVGARAPAPSLFELDAPLVLDEASGLG
eukprot:scaffold4173_cov29-Tisochrysis_lutea.AAC.3